MAPPNAFRPVAIYGPPGGQVRIESADGHFLVTDDANAGRYPFPFIPKAFTLVNCFVEARGQQNVGIPGYTWYGQVIQAPPDPQNDWFLLPTDTSHNPTWWQMPLLQPAIPPVPTRAAVCSVQLTFQGLTVATTQYGVLPWFEAAMAWLSLPGDRQTVYRAKRAAGDTHCIVMVPNGPPLYDEVNQPYSPDRFGPLDWTNGETVMDPKFIALVTEIIQSGFTPLIFMDERQDHSIKILPLVLEALHGAAVDLTPYCVVLPGWDGVFYGWNPDDVVAWAALARAMVPTCYLGLEHNQGHIPLGEGGSDYQPGGRMNGFDVILGEYDGWLPNGSPGDEVWQILGRMVSPYHRPPDQPSGDDPNPPFYLQPPSPRGPYYYCAFEFDEYRWVRGQVTAEQIAQERAYLKACGAKWTG